jgi:hypothetical protein
LKYSVKKMHKLYILLITLLISLGAIAQSTQRDGSGSSSSTQVKILKTYPNPAVSFITFEFQYSYNSGYTIEVYNLPGKRVSVLSNVPSKITLPLQNYYRGVYIYKLVDRYGKVVESGKFQVSK